MIFKIMVITSVLMVVLEMTSFTLTVLKVQSTVESAMIKSGAMASNRTHFFMVTREMMTFQDITVHILAVMGMIL